jgi:hypothetical protein
MWPRWNPTSDRVLGVLGAAMVAGALMLLVFGGEGDDGGAAASVADPPVIELLSPADGETISGGFEVIFRVPGGVDPQPGGWGIGELHVHLAIGGIGIMPRPDDIQRLESGDYLWIAPRPDPGNHALQLFWSGRDHRPMEPGASERIRVQVSP